MDVRTYLTLKKKVIDAGYGDEIEWTHKVSCPKTAEEFFSEYTWVVISTGLKNQIAEGIYDKVMSALRKGKKASSVFGHKGKSAAIDRAFKLQSSYFEGFCNAPNKLAFLESLPWIGSVTKYHLAKNLGLDNMKPDRHLVRIGEAFGLNHFVMCKDLSQQTGDRIGTVDYVIWRAANLKFI